MSQKRSRAVAHLRRYWVAYAIWIGLLVLHSWSLLHYPVVTEDEGWYGSRAWVFFKTGYPFSSLDFGVLERMEGYWAFYEWIPTALQAMVIHLRPWPSVVVLKMFSLLIGFVLLFCIGQIGKRYFGYRAGLVAVLLTGLSGGFCFASHCARQDVMTAALGYGALALMVYSQRSPFVLNVLSGLCVGLAFEAHPYGALFGPGLLAAHVCQSGKGFFRDARVLGFLIGTGCGLFFFYLLHLWVYPQSYFQISKLLYGHTHLPPVLQGNLKAVYGELINSLVVMSKSFGALSVLFAFILYWLYKRGRSSDKILLSFLFAFWASYVLVVTNKKFFYVILWSPALNLLLSPLLAESLEESPLANRLLAWRWNNGWRAALWAIIGAQLMLQMPRLAPNRYEKNYKPALKELHKMIQPGDKIMANQAYWFGFPDHLYYSWEQLVYYRRYNPGSSLEEAMEYLHPDIFIEDAHVQAYIADKPGQDLYAVYLNLPATELKNFLDRKAKLVGTIQDGEYGNIRVFRIDWDR